MPAPKPVIKTHIEQFDYDDRISGVRATYHVQIAIRKNGYAADVQVSHRTTMGPTLAMMKSLQGLLFDAELSCKFIRGGMDADESAIFLVNEETEEVIRIKEQDIHAYIVEVRITYHSNTKNAGSRRVTRHVHDEQEASA